MEKESSQNWTLDSIKEKNLEIVSWKYCAIQVSEQGSHLSLIQKFPQISAAFNLYRRGI